VSRTSGAAVVVSAVVVIWTPPREDG
jgi:hypothetical protein